jgi:hypothetical protein
MVAEFLHTLDADKRAAVQEAVKTLLEASPEIAQTYKTLRPPPDGVVRLARGDDTAKGRTKCGGRGFGVQFTRPDHEDTVIAVEFRASRYNEPAKEFHLYVLGENQKILRDLVYPIERIAWGGERWYHFAIPPTEVPKHFMVGLDFNATGILLNADPTVTESHSSIGTPESGYKPLEKKAEVIMRVLVAPRARAE